MFILKYFVSVSARHVKGPNGNSACGSFQKRLNHQNVNRNFTEEIPQIKTRFGNIRLPYNDQTCSRTRSIVIGMAVSVIYTFFFFFPYTQNRTGLAGESTKLKKKKNKTPILLVAVTSQKRRQNENAHRVIQLYAWKSCFSLDLPLRIEISHAR